MAIRIGRTARDPFYAAVPSDLLRGFAGLLVVTALAISALLGGGLYVVYQSEMIRDAEVLATSVAEALLAQERELLLMPTRPGVVAVGLPEEHFAAFDRRMRRYLPPFGIYKIKIYDADARIVYSTDAAIIGRSDPENPALRSVLGNGQTLSAVKRQGQVGDLGGGVRFDVDVVETYVPIRNGTTVIGSFEVYLDIGRHYEQLRWSVFASVPVLLLIIVSAFAVLYAFARSGTARFAAALAELERRDATDALTGALTHHALLDKAAALRRRLAAAVGESGTICFALIEVDQFPSLVDASTPVLVDETLRLVSEAIREQMGEDDLLGRHRGGTFLAVVDRSDLSDAVLFGERIRRAVAAAMAPSAAGGRSMTASIGITLCTRFDDLGETIRRTEDALRRAKADGRDCVRAV